MLWPNLLAIALLSRRQRGCSTLPPLLKPPVRLRRRGQPQTPPGKRALHCFPRPLPCLPARLRRAGLLPGLSPWCSPLASRRRRLGGTPALAPVGAGCVPLGLAAGLTTDCAELRGHPSPRTEHALQQGRNPGATVQPKPSFIPSKRPVSLHRWCRQVARPWLPAGPRRASARARACLETRSGSLRVARRDALGRFRPPKTRKT